MRQNPNSSFTRTVKMTPCDYQILEYTNSELRIHGVPFIVILRFHMKNSYALTGYVLQNWEGRIEVGAEGELGDLEVFLEDLQHHCRTFSSSDARFFDRLNGLSVGPLRAFVSGSCLVTDLDSVIPLFFETVDSSAWQSSFDILGKDFWGMQES